MTATEVLRRNSRQSSYWLGTAGAVVYAIGIVLQAWQPQTVAVTMTLRLLALIAFTAFAVRKRSLTVWIIWGMLAGVEFGLDAPAVALQARVFSDIFLRLIKVIVAPLILGTLITGIASHGEMRSVGRLGLKSLIYFEVLTTIALLIGLVAINVSRAGNGIEASAQQAHVAARTDVRVQTGAQPDSALSWQQFLLHVFPENLAKSIAENQILQVAVFALIFGLALGRLKEEQRAPLLRVAESLTQTMFAFTNIVMYYAPIGVGAALAYTVAHSGLGVMTSLAKLLVTLYVALIAFALIAMLPAALVARVPVRGFLSAIAEPATIAFATSTSEAALPRAMEAMEAFGVPRRIVGFVIPTGYSFNLAGSALYLAIASIFVAQAGGMHLGWKQQLFMLFVLMLTSKGVAGVPRAVLVVLLATSSIFQLPQEPIFLILGIDALMDMGRTTVNVVGNCLASAVVAQWEGEFRKEAPADEALAALTE
ncbi:dicarboxylate/amino acid:cation symporter [Alloacidobacterium dinghuense]|uniref:Dicarboxylate/amino acid:cation symporter n=1 Tax=Alloacidobacterium dinghuense TaxID=2763107 RepID=A0A7G8BJA0_9BACT|nr:dicarboxylate/amino acid:cation symporter [Alloacidobacterium dinghuense]QNI32620.1 dicarboxylate/amino acid:cation symporter [Alloacidobacterium dinghuense]